jgi:hypothetical protein
MLFEKKAFDPTDPDHEYWKLKALKTQMKDSWCKLAAGSAGASGSIPNPRPKHIHLENLKKLILLLKL